jgi:flavin-dependent dehydrogenase
MRSITLDGPDGRLWARRWDVLVLGSALPGLVAAVRLGMAGARVLVVGEEAAARTPPLLLEPFYAAGARNGVPRPA